VTRAGCVAAFARARATGAVHFFWAGGGEGLLEIRRSVLVPYSVESMFDLIERAESYPQFLPWCTGARILERNDEWVAARLEFTYLHVRFGFQTRNAKRRPEWLQVRLVEGPFRRFRGDWRLAPLGSAGCRIDFELSYEISDGLLDKIAVPAVEFVSRSMMDAFVKRAENTLTVKAPDAASVAASASRLSPELPATLASSETTMTSPDPALYEALRASPLAKEQSPEQTSVLAGLLSLESFHPKQVLAREGATDNHLVVVVEGSLGVVKHLGTQEETLIATLNAGDFAHELGFLDGAERYASLVAATEARVLVFEREKLESLIETDPKILYRIMCAIVRTVHRVQTRLSMQASELTNYIVKQHGRY
jgi:ribosome-associated toxin RatA of RatAB toxin-antitoxin module/CRP-like cAMP-binding protein